MFRKNVASQFIHFQGVDATTGGIKSGVTWTIRRCIDGTFAAGGGTVTEDGTAGWYKYAMSQADTNGNDIGFNFTGTGAVPQTVNIVTTAADPTDTVRFGLTALPNAAAEAAGGLYTRGTGAGQIEQEDNGKVSINVKQWLRGTIPAVNVTGVPKIDVVDWLGSAPNALISGRVDANTQAIANAVIAAATFAAGAVDSSALNATAITAIWAKTITAPAAAPASAATALAAIAWIFTLARNQIEQTATTQTLRADDNTTPIATSAVSDDGTTMTKAKFA